MKYLPLLLAFATCAQASIFPILSETVSSNAGVFGTGGYNSGVEIAFALDQYDKSDVGNSGLQQDTYLRYSYTFSVEQSTGTKVLSKLILALGSDCASDSECIFGIQTAGASATVGAIKLHTGQPGLNDPIFGIQFDNFSQPTRSLTVSFFSNRVPDAPGRVYARGGSDYLISDAGAVITPNSRMQPQDGGGEDPLTHAPEPMTLGLFGGGLGLIALLKRAKR